METRVLLADDDPEFLDSVAAALEAEGFRVVRAANGVELLEQLGAGAPFDLIVTDVSMPWFSGLQVMHSARYFGTRTPVVVMTALRTPTLAAEVRTLGARAVLLQKPFDLQDLHAAVQAALGRRPTQQANA